MILVDSNILMYAAGATHSNKAPSAALLRQVAQNEVDAALDAEVLQEVLYRYRAIGRWSQGRRVYDAARRIFPTVLPITAPLCQGSCRLERTPSDFGGKETTTHAYHPLWTLADEPGRCF